MTPEGCSHIVLYPKVIVQLITRGRGLYSKTLAPTRPACNPEKLWTLLLVSLLSVVNKAILIKLMSKRG